MPNDREVYLNNKTLPGMEREARKLEVASSLKALQTQDGRNRAVFARDGSFPKGDIEILPSPAVAKRGATKICDGKLWVGEKVMNVTAFRLPAAD